MAVHTSWKKHDKATTGESELSGHPGGTDVPLTALHGVSSELIQALPAAIYTTDARPHNFLQRGCGGTLGLPARDRQKRILRLVEAVLAGWPAATA
jgi:hypothetical protein